MIFCSYRKKYLELENEIVLLVVFAVAFAVVAVSIIAKSNADDNRVAQITDVFLVVQNRLGVHGAVLLG